MRKWFVTLASIVVLLTMAGAAFAGSSPLNATSEDGILVFESDDSAFKWWVDARVYLDAAMYMDDGPLYDPDSGDIDDYEDFWETQDSLAGGAILRRARFAIKSQLWNHWYGEIDLDFADEAAAIKDAYISYRGLFNGNGRVRIGNFRVPNGLEEVTTSRNLTFMERSLGTEPFVVGRRMGIEVTGWYPSFRWSAAVFGADVDDFVKEANEQINFAARLNWAPIATDESTLLLGVSGSMLKPTFKGAINDDGDGYAGSSVKFNTRPETNVSDTKFLYAKYSDVDNYSNFGGELAYVNKRFMFQGEYMIANVNRYEDAGLDHIADGFNASISHGGGYGMVSYFLTDDMRQYDHKDAEFARVTPNAKGGAWELAARYSTADLNDTDAGEENGAATSITLGVNYYPNANVKLMLNYGKVDNDEFATGEKGIYFGDYDFDYVQMRFQTAF
ncbi:MAG: porin [Candidatus Krumholzibacteria bacterium]|nr:porin [Candidatus Krumholzibacteria bacterium]